MCGRYTFKDPEAIAAALTRLGVRPQGKAPLPRRFNVAPTQVMPVVKAEAPWTVEPIRWGHTVQFGPQAKPQLLINARSETAAEKTTFRAGIQERRCLVPADGFYEWRRSDGGKVKIPFHIRLKSEAPFWIAGITWPATDDQPERYIVLTTAPNELMADIHDRMPVIMDDTTAKTWLTPGPLAPAQVRAACASYPAKLMVATKVSPFVNSARHDSPACVEPPPNRVEPGPVVNPGQIDLFD